MPNASDYGYVLENGRIVMEDTCAKLREKDDIKEFYLGMKEEGGGADRRWKKKEELEMRMTHPCGRARSAPPSRGYASGPAKPVPRHSRFKTRHAGRAVDSGHRGNRLCRAASAAPGGDAEGGAGGDDLS